MTQTTARIKKFGKNFEIVVDLEKALKFRKGDSSVTDFFDGDRIFIDLKKGLVPSNKDLEDAFKTTDPVRISEDIVKSGEILLTQEHRDEERDKKFNQVVDFLVNSAIDAQTGQQYTPERIKNALQQAQVNIRNVPVEDQAKEIIEKLSKIIPIRLETKRIKIVIPAIYTGSAYGIVSPHKEEEKWLDNGDLEIIVSVPSGASLFSFYDKLNSLTHGSVLTEEIKQ